MISLEKRKKKQYTAHIQCMAAFHNYDVRSRNNKGSEKAQK